MRPVLAAALLILAGFPGAAAAEAPAAGTARAAVERFGRALVRADTGLFDELLPTGGKIQLRLVVMGPEEGFFSPSQVEALLQSFLDRGAVRAFRPLRVEQDPHGVALARVRADLIDEQGRPVSVELHLAFRFEDERWVLREIRETGP